MIKFTRYLKKFTISVVRNIGALSQCISSYVIFIYIFLFPSQLKCLILENHPVRHKSNNRHDRWWFERGTRKMIHPEKREVNCIRNILPFGYITVIIIIIITKAASRFRLLTIILCHTVHSHNINFLGRLLAIILHIRNY